MGEPATGRALLNAVNTGAAGIWMAVRRTGTSWLMPASTKQDSRRMGRRLHRVDIDPVAPPRVRWIFARRLNGWSAAGIVQC